MIEIKNDIIKELHPKIFDPDQMAMIRERYFSKRPEPIELEEYIERQEAKRKQKNHAR
jgi:hypothetical protein